MLRKSLKVNIVGKIFNRQICSSIICRQEHYDIIIGGGGLVGTALAAGIAKNKTLSEKRVLVLEGAPKYDTSKLDTSTPYSNRVTALNNHTVEYFKHIDAWPRIMEIRVKPVKEMQVWEACSDARIHFHDQNFVHDVAYIVENDVILNAFYKLLEENKSGTVEIQNGARIENVELANEDNEISTVTLKDGKKLTCELLVGADGYNSIVRREMKVDVFSGDYNSKAVVATLELADSDDNCVAWQRFLPTGPVALLPLTDKMSSLVWSTTTEKAQNLLDLPPEIFVERLNEALCKECERNYVVENALKMMNSVMGSSDCRQYPPRVINVLEKSRASFPLGFLHASSYVRSGVAIIGDAAHRVHPLAGQGVNLGFSDVQNLLEVLCEATYAGSKISNLNYLLKYEQRSLLKNVPLIFGIHSLYNMYSTDFSPVVLLRSLGLQFTDNLPALKNIFMKHAMG